MLKYKYEQKHLRVRIPARKLLTLKIVLITEPETFVSSPVRSKSKVKKGFLYIQSELGM